MTGGCSPTGQEPGWPCLLEAQDTSSHQTCSKVGTQKGQGTAAPPLGQWFTPLREFHHRVQSALSLCVFSQLLTLLSRHDLPQQSWRRHPEELILPSHCCPKNKPRLSTQERFPFSIPYPVTVRVPMGGDHPRKVMVTCDVP